MVQTKTIVEKQKPKKNNKGSNRPRIPRSYWSRYIDDNLATKQSVSKVLQTLFYPQHGIHRGVAAGLEVSALTYFQQSWDQVTTATDTTLIFMFVPKIIATPATINTVNFLNLGHGSTYANAQTALALAAANRPGPFAVTNPSTEFRIVSASITIIPSGKILERSGEGKIGYLSQFSGFTDANRNNIDQLSISEAWDGTQSMCMHWVPNAEEQMFTGTAGVTPGSLDESGFMGYLTFPVGAGLSFRFETQVGIEYIPNEAYRPFVDRQAPEVTYDTYYHINRIVQTSWRPLMIDTWDNYRARLSMSAPFTLGGRMGIHTTSAGTSGVGFANPILKRYVDDDDDESTYEKVTNYAKDTACNLIQGATGQNFCDSPGSSLLNLAMNNLNNMKNGSQRSIRA